MPPGIGLKFSVLALLAAAAQAQAVLPEVERLLSIKEQASSLVANIPDYTCLETVSRVSLHPNSRDNSADVIGVAVGVVDRKEIYGWPDGGRFLDQQLGDMIGSGMNTTGLYGTLLRGLIYARTEDFRFVAKTELSGESAFRYDFRIAPSEGPWKIRVGKQSGTAGERGSLWAAEKNLTLRRLEVSADGIPAGMPLKKLHLIIDYEAMMISGRRVLLPAKAWVEALQQDGRKNLSHVFFNHCRAFEAESKLSGTSDAPDGAPPPSVRLPKGLDISTILRSSINGADVSPGDAVLAEIARPVVWKGQELIPQGARLEGHVRQIQPLPELRQAALTLEFDRIQTSTGWLQFYGRPTSLRGVTASGKTKGHPAFEAVPDVSGARDVIDPEIPGIVTIYLPATSAQLPAGAAMTWRIEDLGTGLAHGSPKLETRVPVN